MPVGTAGWRRRADAGRGRRFDRRPTRVYLAAACVTGAIGYALMPLAPHFLGLMLIGVIHVGAVGAGYPQLFALAQAVFAEPVRKRAIPLLRSGWSLAWAIGPLAAAGLLLVGGYGGLFQASAIALLVTAAVLCTVASPRRDEPDPPEPKVEREQAQAGGAGSSPPRRVIGAATVSMVLVHGAMFAGSIALPLYVTGDLARPEGEVGLLFSACAVVEIVAALVLVWLMPRIPLRALILSGLALFASYFAITVVAQGIVVLLAAQIARGAAIAVIGTAGLSYFQTLGAKGVGASTALFSNAVTAGSLASGLFAGVLMQWLGPAATLGACGALSLLAGFVFLAGRHRPEPAVEP